jgi:hypothetical protein
MSVDIYSKTAHKLSSKHTAYIESASAAVISMIRCFTGILCNDHLPLYFA